MSVETLLNNITIIGTIKFSLQCNKCLNKNYVNRSTIKSFKRTKSVKCWKCENIMTYKITPKIYVH